MLVTFPLHQMSVAEKIHIMESVWDDLCRQANEFASPMWHNDILDEREADLKHGFDEFIDWDIAKLNLILC